MRLYLAVAVLLLALVAYTEAQEAETIQDKFTKFGEEIAAGSQDIGEKIKSAFENFQNSDVAVNSRTWFSDQIEKLKSKFSDN